MIALKVQQQPTEHDSPELCHEEKPTQVEKNILERHCDVILIPTETALIQMLMMTMINDDDDDDYDNDNRNEARAGQWDDVECNKNLTFVCRLKISILCNCPCAV